jgi:uncharacterized protein (UPF0548 family)
MFMMRDPAPEGIRRFLDSQEALGFSYGEVGATRDSDVPAGYLVDRHRTAIGAGEGGFERAVAALKRFEMFRVRGVRLWPEGAPFEVGTVVAIVARHFGFFSLNADRIIYIDEADDAGIRRFGFAFGTLPEHGLRGEERFRILWDHGGDGRVHYDVLAFSRPSSITARLGYPLRRHVQLRFAADSRAAMLRACGAQP